MHSRFRPILAVFGLLLACSFGAAPQGTQTTFQFTGVCSDCTGNGIGILTLQNYTQGRLMEPADFVSFTYSSNLTNFTIPAGATGFNINGTLPATLPASPSVSISGNGIVFASVAPTELSPTGSWCAGAGCGTDTGTSFTWGPPTSPITSASPAPALNDWMLAGLAAALAVMGSILVKKIQARKAA